MEVREARAEYLAKPGGKQTEVGEIPEDWEVVELGRLILSAEYGSSAKSSSVGRVAVLRMGNLEGGKIDWNDLVYTSDQVEIEKYRLKLGDVLFNRTNTIDLVGKTAIYPGGEAAIFAGYLIRVNVDPLRLDSRFLNYVLNTEFSRRHSKKVLSVAVGQANINAQKLRTYPVPLPPTLAEQQAIADALGDVDALIESLEHLLAKKRQIKQGTMQALLTGHRRLPGFEGAWTQRKLGEISHIKTGGRNNQDKVEDGEYPFFVRSETIERISTYSYDCEAILVPGEGGIGSIFHYICGRFDVHQRVYAITQFVPCVSGKYVYLFMTMNFGPHALQNSVKATVDSLRLPTFLEFSISMPPTVEEQTAIATVLTDMDAEIAALDTKLAKARALKQGMMSELLTGRIRLV